MLFKTFNDLSLLAFPTEMNKNFDTGMRPMDPFMRWDPRFDTNDPTFLLPVGRGWSDDSLNLRVSMPAISEKDFTVSRMGNMLTIRGERKAPADFGRGGMADFALRYGPFERSIDLPSGLDLDKMKAKFHHGVLDIRIPIQSESMAQTVPVTVGEEYGYAVAAA